MAVLTPIVINALTLPTLASALNVEASATCWSTATVLASVQKALTCPAALVCPARVNVKVVLLLLAATYVLTLPRVSTKALVLTLVQWAGLRTG